MTAWLYQGDTLQVVQTFAPESVDSCVTDPPYGLAPGGCSWASFQPAGGKKRRAMHAKQRILSDNPRVHGRSRSPARSSSQIEYDWSLDGLRAFQVWCATWACAVYATLRPGGYVLATGHPRSFHRMACGFEDAGFVVRDQFAWLFGSGFPKSANVAKGLGSGLKPTHEPIMVAQKPFPGSLTAHVTRGGVGALRVDACRVSGARWPPNTLLDEWVAAELDAQLGPRRSGANPTRRHADKFRHVYKPFHGGVCIAHRGEDIGGPSRYFYVAKPRERERHAGAVKNDHPTVKPLALMRWLVRLVTPPGGLVLDPFAGSGTTGLACLEEGLGFVGVEVTPQWARVAAARAQAKLIRVVAA